MNVKHIKKGPFITSLFPSPKGRAHYMVRCTTHHTQPGVTLVEEQQWLLDLPKGVSPHGAAATKRIVGALQREENVLAI